MSATSKTIRLASLIGGLTLTALPARAQFDSPLLSRIQLNLVNPGGKSLAMGGAFVSIADDATAALANPAGVAQLGTYQVGISGKQFRFEPTLQNSNYAQGTGGAYSLIESNEYTLTGKRNEAEFFSIVAPVTKNISIAAYGATNLRYRIDTENDLDPTYRVFFFSRFGVANSLDEEGGVDVRNSLYGLSLGMRFDALTVGAGITVNQLRYELFGVGGASSYRQIADANNTTRISADISTDVTSSRRLGFIGGIRYDLFERGALSIGAVYRRQPGYEVSYTVRGTTASSTFLFSCGQDDPSIPGSGASACGRFKVPDDFSVGLSGRPVPDLLLAVDVQRILYSQLNDGFVPVFAFCGSGACTPSTRTITRGTSDDGTLLRFGAEYTLRLSRATLVFLRAGYYREPAHGNKLALYPDVNRDRQPDSDVPLDVTAPPYTAAYASTFDGGRDENHVSFGVGVSMSRAFSLDLAADLGDTTKSFVASAFYRF